jgi:hypothetical protein
LLKEGLIQHGEALWVQVIAVAPGTVNATKANGTVAAQKL